MEQLRTRLINYVALHNVAITRIAKVLDVSPQLIYQFRGNYGFPLSERVANLLDDYLTERGA